MTTFDNGSPCSINEFKSEKAKKLAEYLMGNFNAFASLVECKTNAEKDIIVTCIKPELSQIKMKDIRFEEIISIHFDKNDKSMPFAYAMRSDFPQVPHLILNLYGYPASLCLYSESYKDIKYSWTAAQFIERIRGWLKGTANGKLHLNDQPLEPLFFGTNQHIALPLTFEESLTAEKIIIKRLELALSGELFQVTDLKNIPIAEYKKQNRSKLPPVAFCIKLPPQKHGIVSHTPKNLYDVSLLMNNAGYDLFSKLHSEMMLLTNDINLIDAPFCLIGFFPKKREVNSQPETTDIWVFLTHDTVGKVGEDIGTYAFTGDKKNPVGALLSRDITKNGSNIKIELANPTFELSSSLATILNGAKQNLTKILAIGAGAIGSHIILNSIKSGLGKWVLVDNDIILPHNLARYALDGLYLGFPKVKAVESAANTTINDTPVVAAFKIDVMEPRGEDIDKIKNHLADSSIILDMSASISVARHITHEIDSAARRISMFLAPSGKDLVILAEDKMRAHRLDLLEMTYYKELISNQELKNHLTPISQTRYANSCRDLSSQISQDHVALHSAIGSRNLKQIIEDDNSYIKIYRAHDDMQTSLTVIPTEEFIHTKLDGWEIYLSRSAASKLQLSRKDKLPNETGGILIGSFDTQYKIIYIVDFTLAPINSKEYPYAFIRGDEGLSDKIKSVQFVTLGKLTYVGEWHSHPEQSECIPSKDDKEILQWIGNYMSGEGLPAVMLIAGDRNQICVCVNNEEKILEVI